MARKPGKSRQVVTLIHEEASRKNIPTAEYQSVTAKEDQDPIEVAWRRRNLDLDPQLVWRGKDVQDWSNLVVQAPPPFIGSESDRTSASGTAQIDGARDQSQDRTRGAVKGRR